MDPDWKIYGKEEGFYQEGGHLETEYHQLNSINQPPKVENKNPTVTVSYETVYKN